MDYSILGSLNSCFKLNNISKIPLMPNLDFRNRIGTPCAHIERLATVETPIPRVGIQRVEPS